LLTTTASYSSCREYGSESTLHLGAEATADVGVAEARSIQRQPLPAGLKFSIAFASAIDTDTAAAGDPISAILRKAVVDPRSKAVLIPEGAVVRGRIVRMEHYPGSHFVIAVTLDNLETAGGLVPIHAKADGPRAQTEAAELHRPGTHIVLPPLGTPRNAAWSRPATHQTGLLSRLPPSPSEVHGTVLGSAAGAAVIHFASIFAT
jgi:hypothetical protein